MTTLSLYFYFFLLIQQRQVKYRRFYYFFIILLNVFLYSKFLHDFTLRIHYDGSGGLCPRSSVRSQALLLLLLCCSFAAGGYGPHVAFYNPVVEHRITLCCYVLQPDCGSHSYQFMSLYLTGLQCMYLPRDALVPSRQRHLPGKKYKLGQQTAIHKGK